MKKFFLLILLAVLIGGCGNEYKQITSADELKTGRIGVWPASGYERMARKNFPDAQMVYVYSLSDLVMNLAEHKVDAIVLGKTYAKLLQAEGMNVDFLPDNLGDAKLSYAVPKSEHGRQLQQQLNEFIANLTANGELAALQAKWLSGDLSKCTFTKTATSGVNGKLRIVTDADNSPYVYLREGQVVGYEAELIDKFCAAYGYDYDVVVENFTTVLADISTQHADIAMNALENSLEHEDMMLFSATNSADQTVAIVSTGGSDNFLSSIADRIHRTLFDENRWRMFVEGTAWTIAATLASIICGTALGLAVFFVYRRNKIFNRITDAVYRTLQGVPILVLLLFFYYVVFGFVTVPAIVVAVTVLAIVLSLTVFTMLKSGTENFPRGQVEAALALGFSERRLFVKFVLPQIVREYFRQYQLALNGILLETSIIGYISVNDLTKMADLIRARTYDAFTSLLIAATVYVLLSRGLLIFTDFIAKKIDPKSRSREEILKGVKL